MKKFLFLLLVPLTAIAIGSAGRTLYLETISTKKTNQSITISPSGSGGVEITGNSHLLKVSETNWMFENNYKVFENMLNKKL